MGRKWRNPITVQGVESADGRLFNLFQFRDLPLAMRWDREDDGQHAGAVSTGVLSRVWQEGELWMGEGEYADTDDALDASKLADLGGQFFSVDPGGSLEYHWEIVDTAGAIVDPADVEIAYDQVYYGHENQDSIKAWLATLRERTVFDLYEVGAVTQVDIPCWPQCRIALLPDTAPPAADGAADGGTASAAPRDPRDRTTAEGRRAQVLLRRLAAGPATRHADFYAQQDLTGYTKFTITDEGQMMGHVAAWNACHRGLTAKCVQPTYQQTFDDFHQGEAALDDGTRLRVGVITFHEGHLSTIEQYNRLMEDPAAQLGTVRLYADDFGIQACGQVHPDCDPQEVARALAGAPSGDWRMTEGRWLLHGLAYVNTPGYAHYESSEGHDTRMVAAIPAPLDFAPGHEGLPVDRAFFDAPSSIIQTAQACDTCPSTPAADDHVHADGDCGCGGTCGGCGTGTGTVATAEQLLAQAQLDMAMGLRGPRAR